MRQPNFAALNRGRHLYSAGRPSLWALARSSSWMSILVLHVIMLYNNHIVQLFRQPLSLIKAFHIISCVNYICQIILGRHWSSLLENPINIRLSRSLKASIGSKCWFAGVNVCLENVWIHSLLQKWMTAPHCVALQQFCKVIICQTCSTSTLSVWMMTVGITSMSRRKFHLSRRIFVDLYCNVGLTSSMMKIFAYN